MEIEIRLFATFRDHLPPGSQSFSFKKSFADGATVADVIESLRLPENEEKISIVNGSHAPMEYILRDGDVLSVFPPIAGG